MTFDGRAPGTPAAAWSADPRFRDLPALALRRTGRTVVVAAHPDDETLGAGGILAELADAGCPAEVVIVSDGGASHPGSPTLDPEALVGRRWAEVVEAVHVAVAGLTDHDAGAPGRWSARGARRHRGRPAGAADRRLPGRPARRDVAGRRPPGPPDRRRGLRGAGRRARLHVPGVPDLAVALGRPRTTPGCRGTGSAWSSWRTGRWSASTGRSRRTPPRSRRCPRTRATRRRCTRRSCGRSTATSRSSSPRSPRGPP